MSNYVFNLYIIFTPGVQKIFHLLLMERKETSKETIVEMLETDTFDLKNYFLELLLTNFRVQAEQ